MEKTTLPTSVAHLPARLKTLSKMCLTALALASVFSYAKMAHQRWKENTQQAIAKLFASEGDTTPDTISMLQTALQRHPSLWIQSKLYFDDRVWQLHNALGRPQVNHYSNSTLRTLLPFISMNHYDALGKTCYIPDSTITQWLTEIPHVYQHQQVGIVNLTLDLCVWTVRSWLHASFYDKTYELPNSLEYHAHHQIEPALLSALFSHDYGVTLINDLHLIPHDEQGSHFLQYMNGLTIYWVSDIQHILKTDAGQLLRERMQTHDGWYKIVDAIASSSMEYKKYRSYFLFTYLKLHAVQLSEIALICYTDARYLAARKNDIVTAYQKDVVLNKALAWTLFATKVQEALLHCHQHPLLQSQLYDIFFEHACVYAEDRIPVPSLQITPFTLKNASYKEQLEALYHKARIEQAWRKNTWKFAFTQLLPFPR